MKVAIITANTDIYKGVKENESGEAVKLVTEEAGLEVVFMRALPLDREVLSAIMKRMADGKRRYKSDRKDHKVSVKLSEKDMDILKAALNRTGMTASAYIRELIRTGGNIDTSYPEDRARAIRVIAGIANNINQAVKLGNSQGRLYYSDIDKLQNSLDDIKKTFGEVLEVWRLQRS